MGFSDHLLNTSISWKNKQFAVKTWKMFQEEGMRRKETERGNEGSTRDQHCPPNSSARPDLNVTSHSNRLSKPTGNQTRKPASALFVLGREAGLSCACKVLWLFCSFSRMCLLHGRIATALFTPCEAIPGHLVPRKLKGALPWDLATLGSYFTWRMMLGLDLSFSGPGLHG